MEELHYVFFDFTNGVFLSTPKRFLWWSSLHDSRALTWEILLLEPAKGKLSVLFLPYKFQAFVIIKSKYESLSMFADIFV